MQWPSDMRDISPDLSHLPDDVRRYLTALTKALRIGLGDDQVLQIFLIGSASYAGGYIHGQSDLDVTVVARSRLDEHVLSRVPSFCSHIILPCPADKLELVVYAYEAVHLKSPGPRYDISLNYNTGRTLSGDHIRYGNHPDDSPHWFILDIAAAHANNIPLKNGPLFSDVFTPPIGRRQVLEALQTSLQWHTEHEATSTYSVLNACRGWRWASQRVFGSKLEGAEYALPLLSGDAALAVKTAVANRAETGSLHQVELKDAEALYARISSELESALHSEISPD